ncbi:MAG: chemotaxis protein CheA [Acetobacteraceae bacterium]|nr:chemotaxis protein CheA [Acetobacteraceae bacterium]
MNQPDPAETYRQEAADLLDQLEQALLDLERAPADADLIDTAFRALHTIKGSGSMFGFDRVAGFTHHMETAFDAVRKGHVPIGSPLIAVALAAKDHIRMLIEQPEVASEADGAAILARLRTAVADMPGLVVGDPAVAALVAGRQGGSGWRLRFRLPRDAMASGTNPLLLLDELRGFGPCQVTATTDAIPLLQALDPTECHVGWDVTLTTSQPRAAIEQVFLFVLDEMELDLQPLVPAQTVRTEPVDRPAAAPGAPAEARPMAAEPRPEPPAAAAPGSASSIRVAAERLDELMDRVGELVIAQSRLKQVAATSNDIQVKSVAEEIERLALELRDTTMSARMVPISQLFGRFRRLVRDLSHELGKDIALITVGEDTELDKTLIERLADPLIHLIRNAIDHGIATPERRIALGKPPQGHVTLSARHLGHEVLIAIADDGRGLDRARILERAQEQGLLPAGAYPSDNELFQVLFQPGFSTAREVTNISGRGVGMDVVRRTIEGLRGTISITSEAGRGSEITLHLPLTLAIIDGLLVRVGRGRYVIPLTAVEECVELSAAVDARSRGYSFLNIRGALVPFLRLRDLFDTGTPAEDYQKVVIVSSGEQRVGLVVDQVIGDHQTVIKSLSKLHADVETFSGATILGDGAVALILEVAHLVAHGHQRQDQMRAAE